MQKGQKRGAVEGANQAELEGTKVPSPAIATAYKVRWRYRADSPIATTTHTFPDPQSLVRWMRDFLGPAIVVIDKLWEQPCD